MNFEYLMVTLTTDRLPSPSLHLSSFSQPLRVCGAVQVTKIKENVSMLRPQTILIQRCFFLLKENFIITSNCNIVATKEIKIGFYGGAIAVPITVFGHHCHTAYLLV